MNISQISKINDYTKEILILNNELDLISKIPELKEVVFIYQGNQFSLKPIDSNLLKSDLKNVFITHLNYYTERLQEQLKEVIEIIENPEKD